MKIVMLSKIEAEAISSALEVNGGDKAALVHWHAQDLWDGDRQPLNDLDLDTVIRALYVGFEIEPSPEAKVREYYVNMLFANGETYAEIIKCTLDLLGTKVEGINC
jgi:hypothetical protein